MSSRPRTTRTLDAAALALACLVAAVLPACGSGQARAPGPAARAPDADTGPTEATSRASEPEAEPGVETFPSASEAARAVLARSRSAEVLGFGEVHQSRADVKVMS